MFKFKNKKIFTGIIIITLFLSLSILSAQNPDNSTSNQISTQDITDNNIDQSIISTNTNKKEVNKQSSNNIENNKDKKYVKHTNNSISNSQNNKNPINIQNTEKYNIKSNTSKNIKTTQETQNKTYTISNSTQLIDTLNDIVSNQSENYNYILNLEDGTYKLQHRNNKLNTQKNLNITIRGIHNNTVLEDGSFDISSSVNLNLSNLQISYLMMRNQGTCTFNNVTASLFNGEGGGKDAIANLGKMSIINSNLNIQIYKSEERVNIEILGDYEHNNNVTDDFYIHQTGGLYNLGLL